MLTLAVNEVRRLFYSPIAWLVLVVFAVQISGLFIGTLTGRVESNMLRAVFDGSATNSVFNNILTGPYRPLFEYTALYVPLITMGVFSRELSSGSINLLYSSPLRSLSILLGKYLGVLTYFSLFAVFLLIWTVLISFYIDGFEWMAALIPVICFCLLVIAFSAIGIYFSSITKHQVVAAVLTIGVLTGLTYVGGIGQTVPGLADAAYWLSSASRAEYAIYGLLASKDVFYFLLLAVLFISLTYLRMLATKLAKPRLFEVTVAAGIIAVVASAGIVTSLPHVTYYYEGRSVKSWTPKERFRQVIEDIEGDWSVTVYINALGPDAVRFTPERRRGWHRFLFDKMRSINPDLSIEYRYFYGPSEQEGLHDRLIRRYGTEDLRTIAEAIAKPYGYNMRGWITADEMRAELGIEEGHGDVFYWFENQGRHIAIRTFDDTGFFPRDVEFGARLKQMMSGPVSLAYVTGQGARDAFSRGDEGHGYLMGEPPKRFAMINQGFEINETDLSAPVPDSIDLLVLPGLTGSLTQSQEQNLLEYIEGGRNLFVMLEPGGLDQNTALFEHLGVETAPGRARLERENAPDIYARAYLDVAAGRNAGLRIGDLRDDSIRPSFEAPILLAASTAGAFTVTRVTRYTEDVDIIADEGVSYETAPVLLLSRTIGENREQRVVVAGDTDFMANKIDGSLFLSRSNNTLFMRKLMMWLSNDEYPIDPEEEAFRDNTLDMSLEDLRSFRLLFFGLVPGLILLLGGVFLAIRRRA